MPTKLDTLSVGMGRIKDKPTLLVKNKKVTPWSTKQSTVDYSCARDKKATLQKSAQVAALVAMRRDELRMVDSDRRTSFDFNRRRRRYSKKVRLFYIVNGTELHRIINGVSVFFTDL